MNGETSKRVIFGSVLACIGCASIAQSSVNIYGTMDVGVWRQSKSADSLGANAGVSTSLNTGGISPSVIGFKGTEDLGGGLSATFNLETHLDPTAGATGLNSFFARGANVGLAGSWGAVKAGQQLVPALIAFAATDPRGVRESLAGTQPWALSSAQNLGPGTATPNSTLAFFASNSVSYQYSASRLYVGALYAFGEVPGRSAANRVISLGSTYTGPFIISASYHQSKWAATGEKSDDKKSVGAGLPVGAGVIKANYLAAKAYDSAGVSYGDWRVMSIGGEYPVAPNHRVTLAFYRGENELTGAGDDRANSIVISDEYSLSKRTTLYVQMAGIRAGHAAGIVVSILGAQPVAGATTYVFNAGVRHRF